MEWMTGKRRLLRLVRRFERHGPAAGQGFWPCALAHMGIEVTTPDAQIARLPRSGPLMVVANHPNGLVGGMVLAELVGRVRTDYRILTRSLLTGVREVAQFTIPVPFPREPSSQERFLDVRPRAMAHLAGGGAIVLFPAGAVAASRTAFGRAVEPEWSPFTAKLICRSGAQVVPVHFPGQNSRAYQVAARFSPTLRQALLLHEVVRALNWPQFPVVGRPIDPAEITARCGNFRALAAWLRETTLELG